MGSGTDLIQRFLTPGMREIVTGQAPGRYDVTMAFP
jgi:hypothetical protein